MSSNDTAVEVNNVGKLFYKQEQKTLKEFLPAFFGGKKTRENFWALQDISFTVKRGESFGVIGHNGSGKSTLLKLLAGVTSPTEGELVCKGRIAPLIELGAGFHPELSGRENIYLNGVILGMKRTEIDQQIESIVDFAGLHEFIDQPLKHYSSGMYFRLAFSVAIHTDPDIYLIDEILAVGDANFQRKCFYKMEELKKKGKTIIFVSHSLEAVKSFCTRAIVLEKGKIILAGESTEVADKYLNIAINI